MVQIVLNKISQTSRISKKYIFSCVCHRVILCISVQNTKKLLKTTCHPSFFFVFQYLLLLFMSVNLEVQLYCSKMFTEKQYTASQNILVSESSNLCLKSSNPCLNSNNPSMSDIKQSMFEIKHSMFEIKQSISDIKQSIFEIKQSMFGIK